MSSPADTRPVDVRAPLDRKYHKAAHRPDRGTPVLLLGRTAPHGQVQRGRGRSHASVTNGAVVREAYAKFATTADFDDYTTWGTSKLAHMNAM